MWIYIYDRGHDCMTSGHDLKPGDPLSLTVKIWSDRNWTFATNSDFLISISLQLSVVDEISNFEIG